MRFTKLYEALKLLDICKPVSPEEAKKRDIEGPAIKLKEALHNAKKTKLPDGTWHIRGDLDVSQCSLISLNCLTVSIVDGDFNCAFNKLTSLEGCPKVVKGDFLCYGNLEEFNELEIKALCDVKGTILE
jgi:hypothetical protein